MNALVALDGPARRLSRECDRRLVQAGAIPSSEERVKGALVLAALQQALRREATTSRRFSTSSHLARWDDLKLDQRAGYAGVGG
jgi:hypothetical protein